MSCNLLSDMRTKFSLPSIPSLTKSNSFQIEHEEEEVQDLSVDFKVKIIKRISKSKYPLYMVSKGPKNFALKLFDDSVEEANLSYFNESRFSQLSHPNIIQIVKTGDSQLAKLSSKTSSAAAILMELGLCDFHSLLETFEMAKAEKLARTYFHQLVEGLEYLHFRGMAHLDLKPANLILGDDYQLKIADFDLAYQEGDIRIIGKGTRSYRAPEVASHTCKKPMLADIYSLGVILFIFKTGFKPYLENELIGSYDMFNLLLNDVEAYWQALESFESNVFDLDNDFKQLFTSMVKADPLKRASLSDIKKSRWYQGEIYEACELKNLMEGVV